MRFLFNFFRNCFSKNRDQFNESPRCPVCLTDLPDLAANKAVLYVLACGHYVCDGCAYRLNPRLKQNQILKCLFCRRHYYTYRMCDTAECCTRCRKILWSSHHVNSVLACGHAYCTTCVFKQKILVYNKNVQFAKCIKCDVYSKIIRLFI